MCQRLHLLLPLNHLLVLQIIPLDTILEVYVKRLDGVEDELYLSDPVISLESNVLV